MAERVAKEFGAPPGFPLLADPDFSVINRYGVFNPEPVNGRKVPHPAVFVIDRAGSVRWKFLNTDARIRAGNKDILLALKELEEK
jgi:peroxiredoxin